MTTRRCGGFVGADKSMSANAVVNSPSSVYCRRVQLSDRVAMAGPVLPTVDGRDADYRVRTAA